MILANHIEFGTLRVRQRNLDRSQPTLAGRIADAVELFFHAPNSARPRAGFFSEPKYYTLIFRPFPRRLAGSEALTLP